MATFIALLRAVNVGGTGKLPMTDLKKLCAGAGFTNIETYIASGNVVLDSDGSEAEVKAALEACLKRYAGKPVGVMVRTGAEMAAVLKNNPFPKAAPNRTVAVFLDRPPARDALETVSNRQRRGSGARQARDLHQLRRDDGEVEAEGPGRGGRDCAQHEHRRQARGNGQAEVAAVACMTL